MTDFDDKLITLKLAQGSYISTIKLFHTYTLSYVPPKKVEYFSQPTVPTVNTQNYVPPQPVSYYSKPTPPPVYTATPVRTTSVIKTQPSTFKQTAPVILSTRISLNVDTTSYQCGVPSRGNRQTTSLIIGGLSGTIYCNLTEPYDHPF